MSSLLENKKLGSYFPSYNKKNFRLIKEIIHTNHKKTRKNMEKIL